MQGIIGVGSPGQIPRQSIPGSSSSITPNVSGDISGLHTQKSYSCIVIDLTGVRANEELQLAGTMIWAVASSVATALLDIRLSDVFNDPIPFQAGTMLSGIPFTKLYLSNAAQVGDTITVFISADQPGDRIGVDA